MLTVYVPKEGVEYFHLPLKVNAYNHVTVILIRPFDQLIFSIHDGGVITF
jgi:hypothetical protein